jgi:hypothetical protein
MDADARRALTLARGLVLLSAVAAFRGCGHAARVPDSLSDPSSIRSVTLELDLRGPDERRRRVLVDRATIDPLLAAARFEPKDPCACAHVERMEFATDGGMIKASLCNHCFDVLEGKTVSHYAMTPEFYAEFCRLLASAPAVNDR